MAIASVILVGTGVTLVYGALTLKKPSPQERGVGAALGVALAALGLATGAAQPARATLELPPAVTTPAPGGTTGGQ